MAELLIPIDQSTMVVEVVRKDIKNLYIRVDRLDGRVRVTAPRRISDDALREAVRKHHAWILRRQMAIARQPTCENGLLHSGDVIQVFGVGHRLEVAECVARQPVCLRSDGVLWLSTRPGAGLDTRRVLLERWYRDQLRERVPSLIEKWEPVLGVSVVEWRIKRMRTRWGSCNTQARRIWLSLELARRPLECLEYVVVHEMVHLQEHGHTRRFYGLLDQYLPEWRVARQLLRGETIPSNALQGLGIESAEKYIGSMTDQTSDGILPNVIQSNTAQSDCKRGPVTDYIACFGVTAWRRTLTLIVRWLA